MKNLAATECVYAIDDDELDGRLKEWIDYHDIIYCAYDIREDDRKTEGFA